VFAAKEQTNPIPGVVLVISAVKITEHWKGRIKNFSRNAGKLYCMNFWEKVDGVLESQNNWMKLMKVDLKKTNLTYESIRNNFWYLYSYLF
jgi:hypothetical protein